MTGLRDLRVAALTWECDGVLSVTLVDPQGAALSPWEPGAHLDLELGGQLRQYSLCGDPADERSYQVAVRQAPDSRGGSDYVHQRLRPGELVPTGEPRNNFRLEWAASYLFIAGGIGITPILPMLRAVVATGRPWRLVYGGRSRATMPFLAALAPYQESVQLVPQDEHGLPDLASLLDQPSPETLIYACGPEPLLAAVEQCCTGWPADAVRLERFRPRPAADQAMPQRSFDVVCQRSGVRVAVAPEVRIVDALEEAGIWVPSACREGICGTCETPVIEGEPDHRDSLLSAAERSAGKVMLPCVSRARSETLVLDL